MTSIRYSTTMSESLAAVREGFSPKQIKMAIGIANDPRYKGGNYSGAVKQIEKIKKGLSNHKQVAAVLKRLNTDFDPEIKDDDEEVTESSAARRDAMRHGAGGRRGIDPADRDDVKATDKDKELAKKNMIMQLRKSKDTKGNFSIEFQDGKKQKVDPKFVDMLLKAHDMIQKPRDKEQFVQMISKSYRDMLKTAKMVSKQLRMGEEVFLEGFELFEKVECPKCKGEGCEHCDGKGYHEEVEIDEMKMDDPKLNKIFDKLKKGQTIKLKTSSTISKGKDFVDYIVKSKNTVNKGRVEKVTLVTKGNEKAVKKFLYKRDGKVTFAIGDMGASIDDIKESAHELAEKLKVSDGVGAWIKDFQKSDAPQFQGKSEEDRKKMALAAFADAGGKLEETELDEGRMKELHGYIEKGMSAQDIAKKMKLDVKTIKSLMDETDKEEVVSEEEEPQKPDSAKEVEQGRDDKKKTRIAQLQLQIAKATETINKLNAQEK